MQKNLDDVSKAPSSTIYPDNNPKYYMQEALSEERLQAVLDYHKNSK